MIVNKNIVIEMYIQLVKVGKRTIQQIKDKEIKQKVQQVLETEN